MTLRFGIVGYPATVSELVEQARTAEGAGFDGWVLSEHHQRTSGYHFGGNLEALAAVAPLTSRILLGTCVLLLPLRHLVALAESTAVLDRLSEGCFMLGVGLGYRREDFDALSVDRRERVVRFEEGLAVLRRAWTEERVTFHGRCYRFDDVLVHPRPATPPPVWVAAWTEAGAQRAGRLGDGWIADPLHSVSALQRLNEAYRAEARAQGRTPCTVLTRFVALGASAADALHRHRAAIEAIFRFYFANRAFTCGVDPWMASVRSPDDIAAELAVPDRVAVGSPEECAQAVARWAQALKAEWALLTFVTDPARSHDDALQAFRAVGAAVQARSATEGVRG